MTRTLKPQGPRGRSREPGGCGQPRVKAPRSKRGNKRRRPGCPAAPGSGAPSVPAGGGRSRGEKASSPLAPGQPQAALPVILSLQELEFVFDPVTRLSHREFKSGLPGLMGGLEPAKERQGGGGGVRQDS